MSESELKIIDYLEFTTIMKVLLLLVPAALLPGMWSVLFVFAGYVPKHRLVMSRKQANGEIFSKASSSGFYPASDD